MRHCRFVAAIQNESQLFYRSFPTMASTAFARFQRESNLTHLLQGELGEFYMLTELGKTAFTDSADVNDTLTTIFDTHLLPYAGQDSVRRFREFALEYVNHFGGKYPADPFKHI